MNYYEILYIINPNFERKKIDDIMKEIDNRLKKTKSKIINHVIWGKKKLAFSRWYNFRVPSGPSSAIGLGWTSEPPKRRAGC